MKLLFKKKYYYTLSISVLAFVACHHNPPGMLAESELKEQTTLPSEVTESSGLAFVNQQIWTHNDSGHGAELYQVDGQSEKIVHTLTIDDIGNRDWEELALDEQFLYIGDFGNNAGNREDLKIYKVAVNQMNANISNTNSAQTIAFHYEDQTNFNNEAYKHNFDCEAMISFGDSLYLFSKNHKNQRCNLYSLSKRDSTGIATKIDSFDSRGTITAADYQAESGVLALLGYRFISGDDMPAFLWVFYDFEGADFLKGKSTYIDLKLNSQAEGITFISPLEVLISTEAESGGKGRLYQLDVGSYVE